MNDKSWKCTVEMCQVWICVIFYSHHQLSTHARPWTWGSWHMEQDIKSLAFLLELHFLSCRSCDVLECFSIQSNWRELGRLAGAEWAAASSHRSVLCKRAEIRPNKQTPNCSFALGSLFISVAFCLLLVALDHLKGWWHPWTLTCREWSRHRQKLPLVTVTLSFVQNQCFVYGCRLWLEVNT